MMLISEIWFSKKIYWSKMTDLRSNPSVWKFLSVSTYQICEWLVLILTKEISSSIIERTVGNFLNCFGKRYRLSAFECRVGCPFTTSSSVFTLSYTSLINHHLEGTFKGKTVGTFEEFSYPGPPNDRASYTELS